MLARRHAQAIERTIAFKATRALSGWIDNFCPGQAHPMSHRGRHNAATELRASRLKSMAITK